MATAEEVILKNEIASIKNGKDGIGTIFAAVHIINSKYHISNNGGNQ